MGYQEDAIAQALALGGEVAKPLESALVWQRRADELNKQLENARRAEEREYSKFVESAISTGKLPELNGYGRWAFDSPSSKLVVAAVAQCHGRAAAAARAAGPGLFGALQKRVADVVAESVKLTKSLPDHVIDERTAVRASADGGNHFAAWVRLGELLGVWEQCHELSRVTARAGWIAGPDHPRDRLPARSYLAYGKPTQLATVPRGTPRERHLAAAQAAGAQPGLFDWSSAIQRYERLDRRQRDYRPMQVIQRHDSFGTLVHEERSPETAGEWAPAAPEAS